MDLVTFQKLFEPVFLAETKKKMESHRLVTSDLFLQEAFQHIVSLAEGGKRLRPYMAWLGYRAAGGQDDSAFFRIAIALEWFHLFALVHDDIIDRGQVRHHVPTMHRYVAEKLVDARRSGEVARFGEAQAILFGDALFGWANEAFLLEEGFSDINARLAKQEYVRLVDEVVVGQMIDVDLLSQARVSDALIEEKMRLKTAGYSFVRPFRIGAALGPKGLQGLETFSLEFGEALGLAFQIQDDLLDIIAPLPDKTMFSDLSEGQHTFFTQHIFTHGSEEEIDLLEQYFGTALRADDVEKIRSLFSTSGALQAGRERMEAQFARAKKLLDVSDLPEDVHQGLSGLLTKIEARTPNQV